MDRYAVYVPRLVTKKDNFAPGHRACIGCGEALAVRLACKAFGDNVIVANATGCMEIVASQIPYSSWRVPWIHTLFENTAAVASGIEAGLKVMKRKGRGPAQDIKVVAIAGDGGTSDIGLQALSGAMERGHDFLYICFDNEAYMNTGIQRSSATPFGASTTTSPAGKVSIGQFSWKKNMPAIAAAHDIPYVATACPSYPFDLMDKVAKGLAVPGPAYIHILSVCPTGWRCATDLAIKLGRLAVETGIFPLYEVENGEYRMSLEVPKLRPAQDYLKLQGRFRHLSDDNIKLIQERVKREYFKLLEKAKNGRKGQTSKRRGKREYCNRYRYDKSLLVSILQDIQAEYRYLPEDALVEVSHSLGVPLSKVYSVATFFRAFSLKPMGRHLVNVCLGTACHVRGAIRILEKIERELGIKPGETTKDLDFTLETVNCVGACALGPIVIADGEYSGEMTADKVKPLIERHG